MSTIAVNTITNAAGGNTAQINGMTPTAQSLQGFRNRLINSDMRIDQRNAGASVSFPTSTNKFVVDRFNGDNSSSSGQAYSLQQVSDAPAGFLKSLKATVTTSGSADTGNYQYIRQAIEGFNFADFMFGTANAQSFTLSFWVKSSLTGTHAGYLGAVSNNRFRVFTYTINAADTWEHKTLTIPGDTAGTWNSTNGVGLQVAWSLSCGTTYQGSPGSWGNTLLLGATGQVQLLETNGATFYITGVQLEAGSVATPFERRPYSTELQLAQRYYWNMVSTGAPYMPFGGVGTALNTASASIPFSSPVPMRTAPSVSASTGSGLILSNDAVGAVAVPTTGVSVLYVGHPANYQLAFTTAAAALTANRPYSLFAYNNTSMSVNFSAEL